MQKKPLSERRLGQLLVDRGLITSDQLDHALNEQKASGARLGEAMIWLGMVGDQPLAEALAEQLQIPLVDLRKETFDQDAARLLPETYELKNLVLPIRQVNGELDVAMADPTDVVVLHELRLITQKQIKPHLAVRQEITDAIERLPRGKARVEQAAKTFTQTSTQQIPAGRALTHIIDTSTGTEAPAVEIVNTLINEALRDRASDIHIEPQPDDLRIRFRIDGVLHEMYRLPNSVAGAVASRIKYLAELDIVERHRSQDGQISMRINDRDLDIRVASIETIYGEKIVLRLLERSRSLITLEQLGFSSQAYDTYRRMVHAPYGMLLCTGPTGAGKTTTLYASLNELDRKQYNVMTIEDPVEYRFTDINQSQISKLGDLTFANGLRAILRQDPDIILVGEIRDVETAEIAVQAALTGHLVLSSLHATDAVGALLRFIDMGVENFLIAASVNAVVGQRLVRRLCTSCKTAHEITAEELEYASSVGVKPPRTMYHGAGCARCNRTGYYDRVGVYEVLEVTDDVKRLIINRASHEAIQKAAMAEGMISMRQDAWHKAAAGETTVPEILRSVYII